MNVKNISWTENKTIKTITFFYRRVCGVWLWANQAVEKQHFCWIFFSQVGWTIQNCQFLLRVCFNQSIKFWEKVSKNNCRKGWLWICLKIKMKYNKNKFHRVCWLKSWQKIEAPIPKSLLSAIFMNWQTMSLTRKNCLQSIKSDDIWWPLASDTKQVWSLLRSWKAFNLWLFVLKSKLFQIASSNNSRKCKFLLSVSSRPKEYWSHIQRPRVPRHDERTV